MLSWLGKGASISQALGKSKGGFTIKIYTLVDALDNSLLIRVSLQDIEMKSTQLKA